MPSRTCAGRARRATSRSPRARGRAGTRARPAPLGGRRSRRRARRRSGARRRRTRAWPAPARPRSPGGAPPDQVDEERDREEERDPRERIATARVTYRLSVITTTAISATTRSPRSVGFMRESGASRCCIRADRERSGDERRAREPGEAAPRLLRRVEPRREHRQQRERPVGVVELLGRPAVVESSSRPSPTWATSSVWLSVRSCPRHGPGRCRPGSTRAAPDRRAGRSRPARRIRDRVVGG